MSHSIDMLIIQIGTRHEFNNIKLPVLPAIWNEVFHDVHLLGTLDNEWLVGGVSSTLESRKSHLEPYSSSLNDIIELDSKEP